jgi:hypothetical protein
MTNLEATFTNISNWHKNVQYSTGGTRSKYIAQHPDTYEEYFFKGSKETPLGEIRFPTEFWSEIVSSKMGQLFGFPMLDYNIAFDEKHNQKIGCISKSMVTESNSKLTEGVYYLTGFKPSYIPSEHKTDYTFHFICSSLVDSNLDDYIVNIIEIIVFDSIIGNSDRHQENWGVIPKYQEIRETLEETTKEVNFNVWEILTRKRAMGIVDNALISNNIKPHEFAPIYDSGCCLGREHTDDKVLKMLDDSQMLNAYIMNGKSEIHWMGEIKKRKHFELIELLLKNNLTTTRSYITRVRDRYNPDSIEKLINDIDKNLPENLSHFKLSDSRKKLMYKLVTLRIEKLIKYL